MPVSLKDLLKQLEDAAKAFDEAELVNASGKLANTICENIATHPEGFVTELNLLSIYAHVQSPTPSHNLNKYLAFYEGNDISN